MKNNIKHIFFMTIFLAILVLAQSSHNYDKLLLQDLKTFTVFKNRVTKGRRSRVLQVCLNHIYFYVSKRKKKKEKRKNKIRFLKWQNF